MHDLFKLGSCCKANIIETLNENIKIIESEIRKNNKEDEITKLLKSISGIGDMLSPTIRYEIGVMSRFFNSKRLASYCRFTPRMHISGKSAKYYKTSKDGNAYLKRAFSEVAVCAIKYDDDVRKHYQRLKSKKGKPVALSIIGRNMTTVLYHVWTTNQEYRGYKKSLQLQRT
ncbi:IS110 family transposase [candidate division KSB1 bacterium]|nr:IS110 family transposase [candidate division KSB1 bacterium]